MHPKDFSKPSTDKLYPFMIITGSAGALMSGLASACFIAGNNIFDWQISVQGTGSITVTLFVLPFLAVMLYGSLRA